MISNQILQSTIDGLKEITRIDLCIIDLEGNVLAATFPEADGYSDAVLAFVDSPADSQVVQLITRHFLSNNSRIVCTCGRISRPLGACMSCGMTKSTKSPSLTRSPVMVCCPKSAGNFSRIA